MATPWYLDPINPNNAYATEYKGFMTDTPHYAYDIETPFHTPLTAPLAGTVVKADYAPWGGEIFVQPDNKSLPEYYFYHPDIVEVHTGEHISAGEEIALSGGQNSGGSHPVSQQWSTGPHTHVGWFTKWVTPPETGETIPYGPDPKNLLDYAKNGGSANDGQWNISQDLYNAVHPIAAKEGVPDKLWETVAFVESGFNTKAVGDNGTSYGLFQLHQGGQLGNLTEQQAFDPATNARQAMPAIAHAWNDLKGNFSAVDANWWEMFAIESGHPGGSLADPATMDEATKLKNAYTTGKATIDNTTAQDIQQSTGDIVQGAVGNVENWISGNAGAFLTRVGVGVLGVALVVIGTVDIAGALKSNGEKSDTVKNIKALIPKQAKTAAKVATKAAVLA